MADNPPPAVTKPAEVKPEAKAADLPKPAPALAPAVVAKAVEVIKATESPFPVKQEAKPEPTKTETQTRHWWEFFKPTQIKVVYYPKPLSIDDPITNTQFKKWVKEAGYIKQPAEKAMWEILMLIAWLTWISMVIGFGVKFLNGSVLDNKFIFQWALFINFITEIALGFSTVVIGQATKLLTKWYEERNKLANPPV